MKFKKKTIYWATGCLLVSIILPWYILKSHNTQGTYSDKAFLKVAAKTTGVANIAETIDVTGSFEALTSVEVVPEISGQLERLRLPDDTLADVGVAVKKGQVIAIINHEVYLAQLAQCQATLEATKVTLADAESKKLRTGKVDTTNEQS